jgi:hypothetical protein
MDNSTAEPANGKWFARIDNQAKPVNLMLYNFIGAKFEAHCIPLDDSQKILTWLEKINQIEEIRQVFEKILFDAAYPDELFEKFLPELCRLRNQRNFS